MPRFGRNGINKDACYFIGKGCVHICTKKSYIVSATSILQAGKICKEAVNMGILKDCIHSVHPWWIDGFLLEKCKKNLEKSRKSAKKSQFCIDVGKKEDYN